MIRSNGMLDLASGEIHDIVFKKHDLATDGWPCDLPDYEFTSGLLEKNGKQMEFTIQVDKSTKKYSVNATELLEVKKKAAILFS